MQVAPRTGVQHRRGAMRQQSRCVILPALLAIVVAGVACTQKAADQALDGAQDGAATAIHEAQEVGERVAGAAKDAAQRTADETKAIVGKTADKTTAIAGDIATKTRDDRQWHRRGDARRQRTRRDVGVRLSPRLGVNASRLDHQEQLDAH